MATKLSQNGNSIKTTKIKATNPCLNNLKTLDIDINCPDPVNDIIKILSTEFTIPTVIDHLYAMLCYYQEHNIDNKYTQSLSNKIKELEIKSETYIFNEDEIQQPTNKNMSSYENSSFDSINDTISIEPTDIYKLIMHMKQENTSLSNQLIEHLQQKIFELKTESEEKDKYIEKLINLHCTKR